MNDHDKASQALERANLYDKRLHWLLNVAPSELGQTGTTRKVVGILELRGFPSGVPNTDLYSDYVVGWCAGKGAVAKWRELDAAWRRLQPEHQRMSLAHYLTRNDFAPALRTALEGALDKLAMAAVWVCEDEELARLLDVCANRAKPGRSAFIAKIRKRAEGRVVALHEDWRGAIAGRLFYDEQPPHWSDAWRAFQAEQAARQRFAVAEPDPQPEAPPEPGAEAAA